MIDKFDVALEAAKGDLPAGAWLPHIFEDPDFREVIEECNKVLIVKGHDYTQGEAKKADPIFRLKNFYRNAERLGTSPFTILSIYMFKHIDAIETYLKKGFVESEPIEGRIVDTINYLLLLTKLIRVEKAKAIEIAGRGGQVIR